MSSCVKLAKTTYKVRSYKFCVGKAPTATVVYTLSLHDALPISGGAERHRARHPGCARKNLRRGRLYRRRAARSEEHTSELQSRRELVCRLLREKKTSTNAPRSRTRPTTCCRTSSRPTRRTSLTS